MVTSKTAVLDGIRQMHWEERSVPEPSKLKVRVKVKRVGVCGSDVHYYTHGRIGGFIYR
jgi:L-iditol 2-dehydrogenase